MARLTVKQVARLSGVSVRTLHYYDEIGLLRPADVGANGYRYYDRPQLLRLQQILFHRQFAMPLDEIRRTLDAPDFDPRSALEAHRTRLIADMARHRRLVRTIDETLSELNGDGDMSEEDTFKGFAPEKQAEYEDYLVNRFGDRAAERIADSKQKVGKMSADQMKAIQAEGEQINTELADAIAAGAAPGDAAVQDLIARHHAWVSHFWTPDAKAYAGLGQLYLEHPDFRAFYDRYDTRLVAFLAEAMAIYAEAALE